MVPTLDGWRVESGNEVYLGGRGVALASKRVASVTTIQVTADLLARIPRLYIGTLHALTLIDQPFAYFVPHGRMGIGWE